MILGGEGSGDVLAIGPMTRVKVGDRVMGSLMGAFAEFALADEGRIYAIPANNMSYEQAASLPDGSQHHAQRRRHRRRIEGRSNSAGSGRKLRRRPDGDADREAQRGSSCDRLVNRCRTPGAVARVSAPISPSIPASPLGSSRSWTRPVATASISSSTRSPVRRRQPRYGRHPLRGSIVNVGRLGGDKATSTSTSTRCAASAMSASPSARGALAPRSREITATHASRPLGRRSPAATAALPIDRVFPLAEIADALAHMKANRHFGKIAVTL